MMNNKELKQTMKQKTKLLLTGATGFINSRLQRYYEDKYEIVGLTRKDADITDFKKIERILKKENPDIILHGAAIAATDTCEENPDLAYRVNTKSAVHIGRIAAEIGAKLVFYSTEQVFNGNQKTGPYTEEDNPVPNTTYGKTKLKAEEKLREVIDELWILRFNWVYGAYERKMPMGSNIFSQVFNAILRNEGIKAAVNEYRGMTYVYDLIENIEEVFKLPYGAYHFGSENELSRYETTKLIFEELQMPEEKTERILIPDYEKYSANKPRDLRLDCSKVKRQGIDFPKTRIGVENFINEYNFK